MEGGDGSSHKHRRNSANHNNNNNSHKTTTRSDHGGRSSNDSSVGGGDRSSMRKEDRDDDLVPFLGGGGGGGQSSKPKSKPLELEVGGNDNDNNDNEYDDDDDDDDDDDGHHGAGPPGSANTIQMVINIIISFVGAGLLGQPHAFMESGWMLGGLALLTVSALNIYAMLRLPAVQLALMKRLAEQDDDDDVDDVDDASQPRQQRPSLNSYSDLGRAVLGPRGESMVVACLAISQAGFATAYIIFIAANLYSIAQISRFWVCMACIPGLMGLVQFRDLKSLSPFSLLANVANFCALSAVLFQDYEQYQPHNDTIHAVQWGGLLYVIGITIYSMEGVGLVLSLQASYQQPQKFGMLLSTTLGVISLFMVLFGAAGYWAFANDTQAPITLNLASHWSATFVKLALCLGLYLTYPIMMFPIWNIWETWQPRLQTDHQSRRWLRSALVVASATVAYCIPHFGKFLSLVGSSICTLLGFVFPCWFHLQVLGKELPWWQYILDIIVLVGGCIFGILGTYQSVMAMVRGEDME